MALHSSIEWTESTWNPVTGCTKVSPGCANCYAERMAKRLKGMGSPSYANGFSLTMHSHLVERPLAWTKPQMIFVNSMSDMFHEGVSDAFVERLFGVMRQASWHTFQILTKRSERLRDVGPRLDWATNIWMGVTVERNDFASRIDDLRATPAEVRFVSFEPLLGPIGDCDLSGIDWAIVGGESGPRARPMDETWAVELRDRCLAASVPFFFKQWGGLRPKDRGRALQGREWSQMPAVATG